MSKIKKEELAHYDRMIAWAKEQKPRDKVSGYKMWDKIGEMWSNDDSSYCKRYGLFCGSCPLSLDLRCCNRLYSDMHNSKTWGTWVKRAEKVREYIRENG